MKQELLEMFAGECERLAEEKETEREWLSDFANMVLGEAADMLERQQHRIAELEAQRERADIIKWHRIHTPDEQEIFYLSRLPSIRTVARTLGYAIGVHGSMRRDLDLIAVPWVEKHSTPDALAKAIQYAACGMHGDVVTWQQKPCGRIATSLPICWTEDNRPSSGHIDLSVMVSNVVFGGTGD